MNGPHTAPPSRSIILCLALGLGSLAQAIEPPAGSRAGTPPPAPRQGGAKTAGCSPASQIAQLAFNNVRAQIMNGGNKWTRGSQSGYEVPKTEDFTGPKSLYAGALWMGGVDPANQLKIAAVLYRNSGRNDFWPGPLTNTGDASTDESTCLQYDRFWTTSRAQAEAHIQWNLCREDPDCRLDDIFPQGYSVPADFITWPAMGNVDAGQDLYLAPFVDWDGDLVYDPFQGDYPDYGFNLSVEDCKNKRREDPVPLFGDNNIYWIFNDKGNAHTETQGQPIGLEVRAQAFSFNSNDEINNMTFYNYVVINQGTQTLLNTYFGHFVDADLGCSNDDFAGCDVQRGLGFVYNWQDVDASCGSQGLGYGGPTPPPPAVGVDFFEGPFQDYDGMDNPLTLDCQVARDQHGIPYAGIGIGYGDGVPDNERFGMRAYIYFNRAAPNANVTDPANATHFYNYLRSIWKNNQIQSYGGTGFSQAPGPGDIRAFYMFPWDTDPVGWGTDCAPQPDWRDEDRTLVDRRFVQSAGPFTLEPGAYNNVTVGVVWARAAQGSATTSVELMRLADDKAQALFDNCFKILDGPDAPDLVIRELDRELIVYIVNPRGSNNENETYRELDPTIPVTDTAGVPYDRFYRFQGYKLYQVKDATVSVTDIEDPNLARLVYQGDARDGVGQIVNHFFDPNLLLTVPREMVNGADQGVVHAIRVTEDKFAQGDPRLVNFKSYYYIAITYGYNNFERFVLNTNPLTGIQSSTGQAFPYVAGRKAAFGAIRSYVGIPHKPNPQDGGTVQNAQFGDQLPITRLEGQGNGGNGLELEQVSEDAIMSGFPWRSDRLTYKRGRGPIEVRVVDPLRVPDAQFEVWFRDSTAAGDLDRAHWSIVNRSTGDTVFSDRTIDLKYEQLLLDWGLSITIGQTPAMTDGLGFPYTEPIGQGRTTFTDPSKPWLTGIPDAEGAVPSNWIRSGTSVFPAPDVAYSDRAGRDDAQIYEGILGGTWAPWVLVGHAPFQPSNTQQSTLSQGAVSQAAHIGETPSIQLVITKDKNKWTRSPVLEQGDGATAVPPSLPNVGGALKLALRADTSIDKNGRKAGTPGANDAEATLNGDQPNGMGWFPGYAIDLETGERLNIAYGENSGWGGAIGRDMIWNPSDQVFTDNGDPVFGGCHWIYVFKNDRRVSQGQTQPPSDQRIPAYDEGRAIHQTIQLTGAVNQRTVFRALAWVGATLVAPGHQLLETDVRIVLNVAKPYRPYRDYPGSLSPITPDRNNGLPLYTFGTGNYAVRTNESETLKEALDIINVVPNPYYAFSGYETSRLDNRIKFINLPQTCTISIYNVGGTLVRKLRKDNDLTFIDWDLKNTNNIPIAGGVYICHIDVPGVGEKVLRWFGAMRPLDLQNF